MCCTYYLLLAVIFVAASPKLRGQNFKQVDLIGHVVDEANEPLPNATTMLLSAEDSLLVNFVTTNPEGRFEFRHVAGGDFIVKIQFLGYVIHHENLTTGNSEVLDLGAIKMVPESQLLGEVEVKADVIPIEIRDDTIAYNAAAFKTQPNPAVEDLLKRLPGVEVDQEGNITAQGKEVQNVLVDGTEFFGTDLQIATKNLPADVVDQVQVFDQLSEMAEFSGIDDGDRQKTIHLQLREDKKKGMFGTMEAGYGYGDEHHYGGKANLNRFSGKSQFSILAQANNTNAQGFSVREFASFSKGINRLTWGSRVRISGDNSARVPISNVLSNGLAATLAGGINYNVDFSDKFELRSSYFYSSIDNDILQATFRQDFITNGAIEMNSNSRSETGNEGHRLNAILEYDLHSTQNLELRMNFSLSNGDFDQLGTSHTTDSGRELTNRNITDYNSVSDEFSFDGQLYYRKRFGRKQGRFLTASGTLMSGNNSGDAKLRSINELINSGDVLVTDQKQFDVGDNLQWGGQIGYTEPLGRNKWLEVNYQYEQNSTESDREVFDVDSTSGADKINERLIMLYNRDFDFHRAGLSFKLNRNKSTLNVGVRYQDSDLRGFVNSLETLIVKDFSNILPSVRYIYRFATARSLRFDYNTNINVPSIQQLSPIVDNSDPLRVYVGNPNLRAEYVHRGSLLFILSASSRQQAFSVCCRPRSPRIRSSQHPSLTRIYENFRPW